MATDTTQRTAAEPVGTSFWSATRLVAEREITAHTRTKGFWLNFGLFVVGIFAAAILPNIFGGGTPTVAAVGPQSEQLLATTDFEVRPADDADAAEELVRTGEVDAAVVPDTTGQSPVGVRVIGHEESPDDVVSALSVSPPVDLLEPSEVDAGVRFFSAFAFAMVFFMFSVGFGMAIAQSVVTEKQTRIVEILVATVPVRALLAGKIIGYSLLVFAQVAVLALLTPIALRAGDQDAVLSWLADALGWFVPFFILGFVLLASMWAVAGALVSRQEDLGSSTALVMTLVMIPYFGVIMFNDNELVMTILSYVPFSAPVAMPVRTFGGEAQAWEPFLALTILLVTLFASVAMATRLYSGSLLQTGSRVRLSRAWSHVE
ncbi:ABC transporter permease [Phytoactinopolyspora halotolerans]|uniref:ABC transporter permease n=1 Tax=Phytoactinopolyspora halotolerans TaxID=1981512 RepID=A0A6L9S5P1_9ACTN|nr:ABC transporter permease [Phytoactinopolyspora halotolerans]NEE00367.1 ABC transporter permease [Phytoactinopolyspora halotolerans]